MPRVLGGKNGNLKCEICGNKRYPNTQICPKCYYKNLKSYKCKVKLQHGYRDTYFDPVFIDCVIEVLDETCLIDKLNKKYGREPINELSNWILVELIEYKEL